MRHLLSLSFVAFFLILSACGSGSKERKTYYESEEENSYEDGTYCATVEYYYSETGTKSSYTLKVEIEDNKLTIIYWPNGGWLDETHFTPPDISSGYAEFTSDRDVDYEVTILDDEDCSPYYVVKDEDELIEDAQEEICPKCGNEKYSWKKYCNRCTDELENTCSQCGGFQYYVNGGLCDDCEKEAKEEDDAKDEF